MGKKKGELYMKNWVGLKMWTSIGADADGDDETLPYDTLGDCIFKCCMWVIVKWLCFLRYKGDIFQSYRKSH